MDCEEKKESMGASGDGGEVTRRYLEGGVYKRSDRF